MKKWIDNSKAGALERCPRYYWLRYVAHLTQQQENAKILFGKSIHYAFEQTFDQIMLGENDLQVLSEVFIESGILYWNKCLENLDPYDVQETYFTEDSFVHIANLWFSETWMLLAQQIDKVCGTELIVKFQLPEPAKDWTYICRADLVFQDISGNLCLIDHKTTGWSPNMLLTTLEADTQLSSYCMALSQKYNKPVSMAYLNIIQYVRRRVKSGAFGKPTCKTQLAPVVISPSRLEMMLWRYVACAVEVERRLEENNWACQPSACGFRGGVCEFHPLLDRIWKEAPSESHIEMALNLGYRIEEWRPFELIA